MRIGALYMTGYGYGRPEEEFDVLEEIPDRALIGTFGDWWCSSHWDSVAPSYEKKGYVALALPEEYLL